MLVSSSQLIIGSSIWLLICITIALASLASGAPLSPINRYRRILSAGAEAFAKRSAKHVDDHDHNQYASEESLITRDPKENFVSKTLRWQLKRNEAKLLSRSQSAGPIRQKLQEKRTSVEEDGEEEDEEQQQEFGIVPDVRSDQDVIKDACKERPTRPCRVAVEWALKKPEDVQHKIALSFRNKPPGVDGNQLIYNKMFESFISNVERRDLDTKLDKGLDLLLMANPATRTGKILLEVAKAAAKPALNAALDRSLSSPSASSGRRSRRDRTEIATPAAS